MPLKGLALFAFLLAMIISANAVNAMNPEVRLPEWCRTSFAIAEWQPKEGVLVIRVEIAANAITLRQISSKLHLPKELSQQADLRERKILKKGDKAVFLHRISIKPDYYGWVEIDLRAMPDQTELLELVRKTHANEPVTATILEAEVKTVSQPITIGTSLPILLRNDIAIGSSEEMTFKPEYKAGQKVFYMWYPPVGIGKGITAEGIKAFDTALRLGNLVKAEAAANMLIKKFTNFDEPLTLEKDNGESFAIPARMVIELINADMLSLRAICNNSTTELEKSLEAMQPGFTRPFLHFNLGVLYENNKDVARAQNAFKKALADLPVWPMASNKIDKSGKQGD